MGPHPKRLNSILLSFFLFLFRLSSHGFGEQTVSHRQRIYNPRLWIRITCRGTIFGPSFMQVQYPHFTRNDIPKGPTLYQPPMHTYLPKMKEFPTTPIRPTSNYTTEPFPCIILSCEAEVTAPLLPCLPQDPLPVRYKAIRSYHWPRPQPRANT